MKKLLFFVLIIFNVNAFGQTGTGAFDALMLEQLLLQVEQLYEQIDTLTDTLDVSKRMEEYEQLKTVKKIMAEGRALYDIVYKLDDIENEVYGFRDDPFGVRRPTDEITWLRGALDNARGNPNASKAYANLLMDIKRLSILGKAHEKSKKRVVDGLNQEDSGQVTSVNTMIMSEILLENQKNDAIRRANNTNVATGILSSSSYNMLGRDSK